jgi:hypothetical protein
MRGVWNAVADRYDVVNSPDQPKATQQRETTRLR